MTVKRIALLSMLISLSAVGRIYLSAVPNIQPTTVIIIISSFLLNPIGAIIVATLSSVVSNLVMGFGLWAFWQALTWAIIGAVSGIVGKYHSRIPLTALSIYAGFCGLAYGFLISVPMSLFAGNFWAYYLAGVPFDLGHAIGNVIFMYILYPIFIRIFGEKIDKL
jgi:energy-coupling factor transport system substrate-specific component